MGEEHEETCNEKKTLPVTLGVDTENTHSHYNVQFNIWALEMRLPALTFSCLDIFPAHVSL